MILRKEGRKLQIQITARDRYFAKKILDSFARNKNEREIFYDLCFCICAPQTTFKSNRRVIEKLIYFGYYEVDFPQSFLEDILKEVRFYRNKARYLQEAKEKFKIILKCVKSNLSAKKKRDFLVKNIKGLGMKAASHFLRNMGDVSLAIIDTHIIKFLGMNRALINSKQKYEYFEELFLARAKKVHLTPAELDSIVWKHYSNTGWEEFVY